jgi:twitching motility protein PilT
MDIVPLLEQLIEKQGSDLHLQPDDPPVVRVFGDLMPLTNQALTPEETESIFSTISFDACRKELEEDYSADFSYALPGKARFRVNAFRQRGHLALVFRHIPVNIPSFEELNLPPVVEDIAKEERGLVLVVGVTGSGKSTTLAAMLDYINQRHGRRIITIEDPIEYIHRSKKSIISQRELGQDARSFASALRSVLRQDPDVILVGELRDLETIRTAIRASETGHLVFSTLHTSDAVQTLDRMIGYFPAEERDLARQQMALNLKAVIAQRLIVRTDGNGRVPALEILRNNSLAQKMLMTNKLKELYQVIKNQQDGMRTFDQSLLELVKTELITEEESMRYALNPAALKRMISGGYSDSDRGGIIGF